ncbi:MAG: hypothetical protein ACRD5Z_23165, partial [Bryobacteraceae bacterium]
MISPKLFLLSNILWLGIPLMARQASPASPPALTDAQRQTERVVACLPPPVIVKDEPPSCSTLTKRMAELHVPGVSVAVIHNGTIEWARGFGVEQLG